MFISFLYRLRDSGVPVGTQEALSLSAGMRAGLHDNSLTGFYFLARSILIHHEGHLDTFDRAFAAHFRGVESLDPQLTQKLLDWLDEIGSATADQVDLTEQQRRELLEMFEQRRREQQERHDGGNYWIGTRGSSPLGQAGSAATGVSTASSGGGRSAVNIADARAYQGYRSDITLDIRQLEVALRRLRAFVREGAEEELDIDATIDATARNAGDLEVITRPTSRPNTHVILMIDVGGSMFPYAELMSRLFSAAKKATHFKELRTYYFHNCVYGKVFETEHFTEPILVHDLMRECGTNYKLIMVGDAYMAPYELGQRSALVTGEPTGLDWLQGLSEHFPRSVWLNPEPESRWTAPTIKEIARVFDMYPMTVDGLTEAMAQLNRGSMARR